MATGLSSHPRRQSRRRPREADVRARPGSRLDVAERTPAGEALRASEAHFRALVENSWDAIGLVAADGTILYGAPSAERVLGYTSGELLGRNWGEFVHPDDLEAVARTFGEIMARPREGVLAACRILHKDGTWHWFEGVGTNLLDEPSVGAIVANFRDVTERRRAEEALRESEARIRVVMDQLPATVWTTDTELRFTSSTGTGPEAWQIRREQLVGRTLQEYLGTDDPMHPGVAAHRRALDGEAVSFDGEFNGLPVHAHVEPLRDPSGQVVGTIGLCIDSSERRVAEEVLRASEARFRALIENSWEAVALYGQDGKTLYASPAVERILGYSFEELADRRAFGLIHPEDLPAIKEAFSARIAGSGDRTVTKTRIQHKDGTWRWLEGVSTNLLDEPSVKGIVANFRDVTDRTRMEGQLRDYAARLQKLSHRLLEAQEAERRHIARELHDEIGQALTAVKLNLEGARRGGGLRGSLDESIRIVEHTLQQVRNLSLDLRPSLIDDLGLVAALRWYGRRQAERAGFTIDFHAEPGFIPVHPEIEIASFRVTQEALTNVARHARASHVVVALALQDGELELKVLDDGVGFDVGAALDRAARGSSVGLLGMQERVSLVGGTIAFESSPRGTEIRAHLPAR